MGFHKGRNQMSRLSKYVKEKIVKVLVAALVVGTVAGNGTLTVQAEEAATVVGEESVSGGDAVVKENVVADPEVTPEATTMVTPEEAAGAGLIMPLTMNLCAEANETVNAVTVDIAGVLGAANGYGIFVEGITEQSGDSEANICTGSLKYYNNIGYTGKGTIYVDGEYTGSGSNIRCSNLILKSASFEQRGNQWFVNGVYVGTTEQIGKIERGQFDLAGAFTAIRTNAENLHAMGTELSSNEISLNDGQNIFRVNGISDFEPKVAVENGKTVVFNITPDGNNFKLVGQSTSGIDNYPEADNANLLVYNFGTYDGTITLSTTRGTILAPCAKVILEAGNNSGRIVAANLQTQAECHFSGNEWHPSEEPTPTVTPTATPTATPSTTPTKPADTDKPTAGGSDVQPQESRDNYVLPQKPVLTLKKKTEVKKPARVKIRSVKKKKGRKLCVKLKKQENALRYQILYGTSKKFKKAKKVKTSSTQVILKIKKGHTYYIKARAYNGAGYGAYSKVKQIKVK